MTISGGGTLTITASEFVPGIGVDGNLTITGTTVTVNGNGLYVEGDFTVSDASRVSVTAGTAAAVNCLGKLTVTGGSSLTGTNDTYHTTNPSVQAKGGITVSGAGSMLRGKTAAGNWAILSMSTITGPVTEPVGGVVGEYVHPLWGTRNTVLNAPGGTPASAATLSIPADPGGPGGNTGGDVGADVPRTGDGSAPLLWLGLALLVGAGLAVSATRRRRKQNGN